MTQVSERKSKWGKVGTIFITTLSIGFCAVAVAYLRTDIPIAAGKYQENRAAAQASGAIFTREDALAMRQVPKSENAYYLLSGFIKEIEPLRVDFDRGATTESEFLDEFKPIEKYLPSVLAASHKNFFIFENDLKSPDEPPSSPHSLIKGVKALCWLADISAKKSDIKTSTELIMAAARISMMVDHDPTFEASERRSEMSEAVDRELSLLITSHGDKPAWQTLIQETLSVLDRPYDFRPCYKFAHWLTLYRVQIELGEIRDPLFADRRIGERFIPRFNTATVSRIHELFGQMLNRYPSDITDYVQIESLDKELFGRYDYSSMSVQTFYFSLYRYGGCIWQARLEKAERNAVIQALAIKKQKLDPANGLSLQGPQSMDIDGKPIRMKHLPSGWIVYSVGRDGRDNGGDESQRFNRDWVVHLPK